MNSYKAEMARIDAQRTQLRKDKRITAYMLTAIGVVWAVAVVLMGW